MPLDSVRINAFRILSPTMFLAEFTRAGLEAFLQSFGGDRSPMVFEGPKGRIGMVMIAETGYLLICIDYPIEEFYRGSGW